jgi:CCR4-NOT transcription complex subunit 4
LVYVIGLAPNIASENKIKSLDFFGQYGKIEKIVINTNNVYNGSKGGPSYSGYITYSNPRESAIAILSVD